MSVAHSEPCNGLQDINFYKMFQSYRESLPKQGQFLNKLLVMIESKFLFLKATRQRLWHLHLSSKDRFF